MAVLRMLYGINIINFSMVRQYRDTDVYYRLISTAGDLYIHVMNHGIGINGILLS